MRTYSLVLAGLAAAFLARVGGQLAVALGSGGSLPPMEEWQSGLLPYPVLLAFQALILAFQLEVSRQLWVGSGPLSRPRPRVGNALRWFSVIYFLAMLARYVVTMWLLPERRWFGGTIPIFFHWVLASYLYVLSRYHRRPAPSPV